MKQLTDRTIAEMAVKNKGHTTGFDYLRIGLATGVVLQHCAVESNPTSNAWTYGNTYVWYFILPAFFALSGYLVLGSLFRNSITQFAALRILRIVPALAVEVFLSATLLGAIYTSLPLSDYFTHIDFYKYFLNIIGEIHFTLPGVFNGGFVNAQLWTIPYELKCYIFLIGIALVTLKFPYLQKHFPVAILLFATLLTARELLRFQPDGGELHVNGRSLELAFLWACSIYLFKEKLPFSKTLMIILFVLGVVLLEIYETRYLAIIPLSYATVCFGLLKLPKIPFGDLSYGVFLFHYPIMQTLHIEMGVNNTLLLMALTIPLSALFAMGSWTLVEKPILDRKTQILASITRFELQVKSALVRSPKS
ncbi:acyltransferase [Rhodobacteraceae bacterium F11138]|nr:acyltransferase [Rhodobacteraceae bacterium F11138]